MDLRLIIFAACITGVFTWLPHRGSRQTQCVCPEDRQPVCVGGNREYASACHAKCRGISEYTVGPCPRDVHDLGSRDRSSDCGCGDLYDPVCGENGRDYPNVCTALCNRVKYIRGRCSESRRRVARCFCNPVLSPVCGDGMRFGNPCTAKCLGVTDYEPC